MVNNIKQQISRNLINIPGFRTKRKIVVFESDDWGSIRMPSMKAYEALKKYGIPVHKSPYCKFDALESNTDMEWLLDLLLSYKDFKGNPPIITANTVVANPDFKKIKESNFKEYFYESFIETLKRYPNHDKVEALYKKGLSEKIFFPQFHGREHVNVEMWMKLLRENKNFQFAFSQEMWGLSNDVFPNSKSIQATFDSDNEFFLANSVKEGLALFKEIFQYESQSFIANNFIWSLALSKVLAEKGVIHLQGMKYQKLPKVSTDKRKLVRHYLGERNEYNQIYSIRNCSFEPSIDGESHKKTIKEIQNAFFWNKPSVISTHRINFIGSLDANNQMDNLKEFKLLLTEILKKWPDVEFMTTMDLDKIMRCKTNTFGF